MRHSASSADFQARAQRRTVAASRSARFNACSRVPSLRRAAYPTRRASDRVGTGSGWWRGDVVVAALLIAMVVAGLTASAIAHGPDRATQRAGAFRTRRVAAQGAQAALFLPIALRVDTTGADSDWQAHPGPAPRATDNPSTPGASATAAPTALPTVGPGGSVGARHFKSGPVQVDAAGDTVWIAQSHADAVARYRVADGSVAHFALGAAVDGTAAGRDVPLGLAVSEDGDSVWVAAHDSDRVYVLDARDGRVRRVLSMPWGSGPYSVALQPPDEGGAQRWALVTLHRSDQVAAIDTISFDMTLLGPMFRTPHAIAWADDGASAWVTHLLTGGEHPRLSRIDVADGPPRVTTRLRLFAATPRDSGAMGEADSGRNTAEGGYLNWRGHPAQWPGEGPRRLWLPTQYHNMHTDQFTPDSTIQASLRQVDLDDHRLLVDEKIVLSAAHVHDPKGGDKNPAWMGYGWDVPISGLVDLAFARLRGRWFALVVGEQSDNVVLLPADSAMWRSRTDPGAPGLPAVAIGNRPMGVAVSPIRAEAYAYNSVSADLSVLDLQDPSAPKERARIGLAPPHRADLLADPKLRRGAALFFTSADPRLSDNGKVACASCHLNAETDARHWAFERLPDGTNGQAHGPRRTIDLRGFGLGLRASSGNRDPATGFGFVHRSGDRDEVQDFEWTTRSPIMGGTGFLGADAQPELGAPNAGRDEDLDAIAAFVEALPPLGRSPHREPDGRLSRAAVRGATFFLGTGGRPADAQCSSCHVPETDFQDFGFHDVGATRLPGEAELGADRRAACRWCVGTLSLRGAFGHAPWEGAYGYIGTMFELIADFDRADRPRAHGDVSGLTGRQRADLAAFVSSIDGSLDAAAVRALRDTQPPRILEVRPVGPRRILVTFDESVNGTSAADPAAWSLRVRGTGAAIAIEGAELDQALGDRLRLDTGIMEAGGAYQLAPILPIRDVAGNASGNASNALDPSDPALAFAFDLPEVITLSLGASGYEDLRIGVHDAALVGPGLATWSHDSLWIGTQQAVPIPGFVRFDWRDAFVAATGVEDADRILDVRLVLQPLHGDLQRMELRRVLQPWSDPAVGGDWNSSATGAPTWRDHSHPNGRWNQAGASALGGTGARAADYDGAFDLAAAVDSIASMRSITEPAVFEGEALGSAYRFWFEHPEYDYGHAVRVLPNPPFQPAVKFHNHESDRRQRGPQLLITYRLP